MGQNVEWDKTSNGKQSTIKNVDIVKWKKHQMGQNVEWKTYIED